MTKMQQSQSTTIDVATKDTKTNVRLLDLQKTKFFFDGDYTCIWLCVLIVIIPEHFDDLTGSG
jgi:hypothetical protein